jgi:hypothetical protein
VLRRVEIGGHRGLLLDEPAYPTGGLHGGHIAAIWNRGASGYVLSLHFTEQRHAPSPSWQQTVIDTADAMNLPAGRIAASGGGSQSQTSGREYQVSMHGHNNSARPVLVATALAAELPTTCRR